MRNKRGDLFAEHCDVLCISTNGFVKTNGRCVMGRGCAKQAMQLYPDIDLKLGKLLLERGNQPHGLVRDGNKIIGSYPVKPIQAVFNGNNAVHHMRNKFCLNDVVPGWACKADMDIIMASAEYLADAAVRHGWETIVIPRVGCGAGELDWEKVEPKLQEVLDDKFIAMTF